MWAEYPKWENPFPLGWLEVRSVGIGDRLKQVRGQFNQADVAAQLGVSENTWGRYEREERQPDADFLLLLRQKKGINVDWLLTGEGQKASFPPDFLGVNELGATYGEFALVPRYDVRAKGGPGGALVTNENQVDSLVFKRDFLRNELAASPQDLRLIHVEGDSMEPTLRAGDVILIDHRRTNADREGIYVLRMDDALLVKRLQRQPGGRIVASSDNPAYAPFDVDLKAVHNGLAIVGRVVWAGRRF